MNITVIGIGYVGLVTGTIFAELGNNVSCIDIDEERIHRLQKGIVPIYEPGLEELIQKNQKSKRLIFSTKLERALPSSKVIFIAVGTPSDKNGQADLRYVKMVTKDIGKALENLPASKQMYRVIVNKSTVPVGTGNMVDQMIRKYYQGPLDVVSNPEFLREGSAVQDCLHPDRIVVGNGNEKARKVMTELYRPLEAPLLFTDIKSAEMIKYASNALLATEISFANSIAHVCEKVGADVEKVTAGMKLDRRIGKNAFLNAGSGYGGSCFPKDVKALIKTAHEKGFHFEILEATERINEYQKRMVVEKLKKLVGKNLRSKTIAVWGLAFKPKTDDMREAVSVVVIQKLLASGAKLQVYDPVATENARKLLPSKRIHFAQSAFAAVTQADALIVLTEWDEFKQANMLEVQELMKRPNLLDGRNIFDPEKMRNHGFNYLSIGR